MGSLIYGFFNTLVKGIFWLISMIASLILTPIISAFELIIPSGFNDIFNNVIVYFGKVLSFIPHAIDLMMIPRAAIIMFLDFIIIYTTVQLSVRGFYFLYNAYKNLKL